MEWLLREAVSNLVDNAIRYTAPGGVVTVVVRGQAGQARLAVEDSGPGMSVEDIARAGIRFRRGPGARARLARHAGVFPGNTSRCCVAPGKSRFLKGIGKLRFCTVASAGCTTGRQAASSASHA